MHHSNHYSRKKYLPESLFIRDVNNSGNKGKTKLLFMEKENPKVLVSKATTTIKYETAPFMPAIHSA